MSLSPIRRLAFRLGGGVAVVLLVAALSCLDRVDHRPYFQTAYYSRTSERLRQAEPSTRIVSGPLQAGFAKVRLTPEPNQFPSLPLAGYGSRQGKPATGVHDDLYVTAVAFQVQDQLGVMVSADALIVPLEVAELTLNQLKRQWPLRREQVYFSATHTHASLGGWGEGLVAEAFAGPFTPGVREWMADRLAAAVIAAIADIRPASIGTASFTAPESVRNRLVGKAGQVDSEFSFLVVRQAEGAVGVVGSYAAHATVLSARVMEFSGDYPGAWQRAVEKATGGHALFLAGGMGSHAPVPGASGFEGMEQMGQALARKLTTRLSSLPLTNQITFGLLGLSPTLPPLNVRVTDGLRLRPWLAQALLPREGAETFLQAFRLQDAIWISTPCDFSGELALGIKDSLARRGMQAVVTSFNGDYIGYVVPRRYYHLDAYESRVMSFYGPNVPDYLDEMIRSLAAATTIIPSPSASPR